MVVFVKISSSNKLINSVHNNMIATLSEVNCFDYTLTEYIIIRAWLKLTFSACIKVE